MTENPNIFNSGNQVTILNTTPGTILLLSVESPDVPEWVVRPTGLEAEAEELQPGETFVFGIAPDLKHAECHIEAVWMD